MKDPLAADDLFREFRASRFLPRNDDFQAGLHMPLCASVRTVHQFGKEKLENATTSALPAPMGKKGLIDRVKGISRLFLITVVLPTAIASIYYGLIASDVYVSESRFVVRSAQRQGQSNVLGSILSGTGLSHTSEDTYPVIDFIKSRDALRQLDKNGFVAIAYGNHGDLFSRFPKALDDSFEGLWKYYNRNIVSVDYDTTSSIATLKVNAYDAADARKINESLLEMSEALINRMNDRALSDTVRVAQQEVNDASQKARDAAAALAVYRNSHTVFDPDKQSVLQFQQVSTLQSKLFDAQIQLIQLQSIAPDNPEIPTLKTRIAALQRQVAESEGAVSGSNNSLAAIAAEYARLNLDAQFADKQLTVSMAELESARTDAIRKQLYLERLVEPNTPDVATEPRKVKIIASVLALGLMTWGILTLLIAGIREHND